MKLFSTSTKVTATATPATTATTVMLLLSTMLASQQLNGVEAKRGILRRPPQSNTGDQQQSADDNVLGGLHRFSGGGFGAGDVTMPESLQDSNVAVAFLPTAAAAAGSGGSEAQKDGQQSYIGRFFGSLTSLSVGGSTGGDEDDDTISKPFTIDNILNLDQETFLQYYTSS